MFKSSLYLILLLAVCCKDVSSNSIGEDCTSRSNANTDGMLKARNVSASYNCLGKRKPTDCADILQMGYNKSGIYKIWPVSRVMRSKTLNVYCDMVTDGGGWTVIQRRGDFQRLQDYFYKCWRSYQEGFGDIETDFWLGNDNIFALTNQKLYSVRFDLKDSEGEERYAVYDTFWIADEKQKYALHISDYHGDAGESMIARSHNQKFSTKDQDNDEHPFTSCANYYKGAWWYGRCFHAHLNGLYYKENSGTAEDGIVWSSWKGFYESLEWTEIKIRPKDFRNSSKIQN